MSELVFEIEYVDRATGEIVTRTVGEMRLAQKLARELAVAHGRRAVIRRKAAGRTWTVLAVVPETEDVFVVERGISKRAASLAWRRWRFDREGAVLLLWPESATMPRRFA